MELKASSGGWLCAWLWQLSNMILAEELADDTEYQEIISDVKEEAAKHGTVVSVQVGR